jgi:hypothetical protein
MPIKHIKTAVGADDPDPNKIQAGDWNNTHTIDSQGLVIPSIASASVTTPSAGSTTLFTDSSTNNLSQKNSSGIISDLANGSSPPQVDLTSASTDQTLSLGQTGFIDIPSGAPVTTRALKVASGDNQTFEIKLIGDVGISFIATATPASLQPNNGNIPSGTINRALMATTNSTALPFSDTAFVNFPLCSTGNPWIVRAIVSTRTTSKSVLAQSWGAYTGTLTEGDVGSIWSDNAIAWTSLGTILFPSNWSGRILITKLSDSSAGGGTPGVIAAGSSTEVQYRNGGSLAPASNVNVENNNLSFTNLTALPSAPISGRTSMYVFKTDPTFSPHLDFPRYHRNDGRVIDLMPDGRHIIETNWYGINAAVYAVGFGATATGTVTTVTESSTNIYTQTRKAETLVTVAATTAVAGQRANTNNMTVGGPVANVGGFYLESIGGPATGLATTTSRFFMGVSVATAAPTDVEPSSIANIIGLGYDAADANFQLMYRGAAAVTKVELGASFPVPTADRTELYKLQLFSPPGTTQSVIFQITRLSTGAVASGTLTTNLPTNTTYLGYRIWSSVGGTSSVTGVALNRMQCLIYV